jgi:hypothetical protein
MSPESLSRWLALREEADSGARAATLTRAVIERLRPLASVQVLDLGAGTGANVRYLAPRIPAPQRWLLVDYDATLLAEAQARTVAWSDPLGCEVRTRRLDLVTVDRPDIFAGRHLVTASALLDLVSRRWLEILAARCREVHATAFFVLNYNGASRCTPPEPEDEEIRTLMNRHQHSDKGLGGLAAGPAAADCANQCFSAVGYDVRLEPSDWVLRPDQRDLQRQLIQGWAHAALEMAPGRRRAIYDWLGRRLSHVEAGRSHIIVGHDDLAAWPR